MVDQSNQIGSYYTLPVHHWLDETLSGWWNGVSHMILVHLT